MEQEPFDLSQLFPNIAAQMRGAMANLRLAAAQLAPAAARETDPDLDARAALLDQSYYRLLRLVNDLTAAGCLGQEEPPLPLRDRDLTETARSLCDSARGLAELLGLRLEFRSARQQQICAFHRPSIEQLLFQLLSNAFRATPPGGTVTVEIRPAGHQVLLSVTDTGCGIQEEQLPHLFDRFLRREDCPGPAAPRSGSGSAHLPAHRRTPRRHHDGGVPARSGLPVHPLPPGPALRKHGRIGCAL